MKLKSIKFKKISKKNDIQVSVLITTCNRQKKLISCLRSLIVGSYTHYEIIVIDQSDVFKKNEVILKLLKKSPQTTYVFFKEKNKSKGLNFALTLAKSPIIAFTDDDCIVDKNWLKSIVSSFSKNKKIGGIFGKTKAYQPNLHKNEICPCTFENGVAHNIDKPSKHWATIGFGNNMAFRKNVFFQLGGFYEWLGPGTITHAAEDAELSLRALSNGMRLRYEPNMVVYHDRWLAAEEYQKQLLHYFCGEIACYGHFLFLGFPFAREVISEDLAGIIRKFKQAVYILLGLSDKKGLQILLTTIKQLYWFGACLAISFYYSRVSKYVK